MAPTALAESVQFYAIKLASKFHHRQHPAFDFEDLVQSALLGAVEAAHKYDPNHDSKANFMTFAVHPMMNKLLASYRKATPAHIPRREYQEMTQTERGRHIWSSHTSMSAPIYVAPDGSDELSLENLLVDDEATSQLDVCLEDAKKQEVWNLVKSLKIEEQKLVMAVFGLGGHREMKVSEIAAFRGVTRQAVHQQLANALKKLERLAISRGLSA